VLSFVFFSLGLIVGAMALYIYLRLDQETAHQHRHGLEARLRAIEEQCSYLAMRLEESQKSFPPSRSRKNQPQHEGRQKALSLLVEGSDPSSAARATNVPLGQVELLNKLYRKDG